MKNKKELVRILTVSYLPVIPVLVAVLMVMQVSGLQAAEKWDELKSIISDYGIRGTFGNADVHLHAGNINSNLRWSKGPRLGNGDIGVVVDADSVSQQFYISKSDYWLDIGYTGGQNVGKGALGGVVISAYEPTADTNRVITPATLSYNATQEILDPVVTVNQHIANRRFTSKSFVQEAGKDNLMITELTMDVSESSPMVLYVSAWTLAATGNTTGAGTGNGYVYANRTVAPDRRQQQRTYLDEYWSSRGAIALTVLGADGVEAKTLSKDAVGKAHGYYKVNIKPGQTIQIISAVDGAGGIPAALQSAQVYSERAGAIVKAVKDNDIRIIKGAHAEWWKNYWLKSYVQLNDEVMNKYYYGALYDLACNIQEGKAAPGISGLFHMADVSYRLAWQGLYFLNYNFQSIFWGVLSANRPELMQPLNEQTFGEMLHAQGAAATDGFRGYIYDRTYGPKGINVTGWKELILDKWAPIPIADTQKRTAKEGGFWNYQKSIGAFQAVDIIKYYNYTMDADFLKKAYPLIKGLSEYWEDYFTKENAGIDNGYRSERKVYNGNGPYQYAVWDSGSRENDEPGTDGSYGMKNSTMDIAYSRYVIQTAIEWSKKLGVDEAKRPVWQDLLDHVCDLPTATHPVFDAWLNKHFNYPSTTLVLAERSNDIPGRIGSETQRDGRNNRNDYGIGDNVDNCSAVFPGEIINIGSDPKWVQIAKNTVEVMNMSYSGPNLRPEQADVNVEAGVSWRQNNNFPKVFSVAARCGYDADKLYDAFRETTKARLMPNMVVSDNMHGIEKDGGLEAINSMLIQGHEGIIRLFPVWPRSKDAKFVDLRQRGAFLVSSELKGGVVQPTTIISEAGETLVLQSPWESGIIVIDSKGNTVVVNEGIEKNTGFTTFTFSTKKGETYTASAPMLQWQEVASGVWKTVFGNPGSYNLLTAAASVPNLLAIEKMGASDLTIAMNAIKAEMVNGKAYFRFPLERGEQIFGLGLNFQTVHQRGRILNMHMDAYEGSDNGRSHAPVPFYVSSRGYGVLINSAEYITVYAGSANRKDSNDPPEVKDRNTDRTWTAAPYSDMLEVLVPAEGVEVLVFAGPTSLEAVRRYNLYCGGGCLPPRWGLGFTQRVHRLLTADQVFAEAEEFEKRGFPLDFIGLEPGWQSRSYPCTFEWDKGRFPDPAGFVKTMKDKGIRLNLWTNPYVSPEASIFKALEPYTATHTVWCGIVPDLNHPKAKEILSAQFKKDQVDIGVSGYKLDEVDGNDNFLWPDVAKFPSGVNAINMRQTYGVLIQKLIDDLYRQRNQRTYGLSRGSNVGANSLPNVIYSDWYRHEEFVTALVNCGFIGVLWSPEVRQSRTAEEWLRRIQTVVFSPMAMINAWSSGTKPWTFDTVSVQVKYYANLRMQLMPYLYSEFAKYHFEGTPPFRAMALEPGFIVDNQMDLVNWRLHDNPYLQAVSRQVRDQYMTGENLLVAPMFTGQESRSVILPQGKWYDFYTGEYAGDGEVITVTPGLDRIPVYVKDGGMIPMMETRLHAPAKGEKINIEVWHYGEKPGRYMLYDDDGETYDYEKGDFSWREINVDKNRRGQWEGRISVAEKGKPDNIGKVTFRFMGK